MKVNDIVTFMFFIQQLKYKIFNGGFQEEDSRIMIIIQNIING